MRCIYYYLNITPWCNFYSLAKLRRILELTI